MSTGAQVMEILFSATTPRQGREARRDGQVA
jgi:hypothetical protein